MLLILVFLVGAVLWGYFQSNPQGVRGGRRLACNVAVLVLAAATAGLVGILLYADAVVVKADEKGLATYLAIMAGGTSFLIVVALGGLLRNLVIFPLSRRAAPKPPSGA